MLWVCLVGCRVFVVVLFVAVSLVVAWLVAVLCVLRFVGMVLVFGSVCLDSLTH